MNIENIVNKLEIKNNELECNYLKTMCFIANSEKSYTNDIIIELNDIELDIIKSRSVKGKWKLYSELSNYEMKYIMTILSRINKGSLIIFITNEISFKKIFFINENKLYKYYRDSNSCLDCLGDVSLYNIMRHNLIDLESYRDIILNNSLPFSLLS